MSLSHHLAFDLGAENGRAVLGILEGDRLSIREIHRFANVPVLQDGVLRWNVEMILREMKHGLTKAARSVSQIDSAAVDSWGVDFGLLDARKNLLAPPMCYRDARHVRAMNAFLKNMPADRLYRRTGLQLLPFNSLFQLHGLAGSPELRAAARLLFIPGLMTFLLSGIRANDETIASTSQLADPHRTGWCEDILAALGLSTGLMGPMVPPGSKVGRVSPFVRAETNCSNILMIATAGHDTASAVAAVPAEGDDWAYLSSGTWSLLGLEIPRPIITPDSERFNFTNERGLAGRIRFLKNISGLWLIQQCRRRWLESDPALTYDRIFAQAETAPAFRSLIDPDDPDFLNPADMPSAVRNFCRKTGQPAPESPAEISRCILESLALKYRLVLDQLRETTGRPIRRLHIIGGGSQNTLLNSFTAAATHLPVFAGPVEATSIGNILVQATALGRVKNPEEIRAIVARSFPVRKYEPLISKDWDDAYKAFVKIVEPGGKDGRN